MHQPESAIPQHVDINLQTTCHPWTFYLSRFTFPPNFLSIQYRNIINPDLPYIIPNICF